MAVYEKNTLLTNKDASGNKTLFYPLTRLDCVDGAEDLLHYGQVQSLTDEEKSQALENIGAASKNHTHTNTPITSEGTGSAYTATVPGITSLTAGASFVMVPNVTSSVTDPTLDVNGLGAVTIKRWLSYGMASRVAGGVTTWLCKGRPISLVYDGTYWIALDFTQPCASDLYGNLSSDKVSYMNESGGTTATLTTQLDLIYLTDSELNKLSAALD